MSVLPAMRSLGPNPVDVHVGQRLRERRAIRGFSQERLGELLGLTFQQIQKYERGVNRIGSSRLLEICRVLDVAPAFFFDDAPASPGRHGKALQNDGFALAEEGAAPFDLTGVPEEASPFHHRDVLELVRAFNRIRDPLVRRRLFELTKALATLEYRESVEAPPPA